MWQDNQKSFAMIYRKPQCLLFTSLLVARYESTMVMFIHNNNLIVLIIIIIITHKGEVDEWPRKVTILTHKDHNKRNNLELELVATHNTKGHPNLQLWQLHL